MASLWLLSCFTLIGASLGSGAPADDPELSIMPRIINGEDAAPGAWPWHVSLVKSSGVFVCGGSLISQNWVVTAAHCNITTSHRAVTGLVDINFSESAIEILAIAQVFTHPKFNLTKVYSDIALLKLATPAHFKNNVSPVYLPSAYDNFRPWTWCTIIGWGKTSTNGTVYPKKLQQARVRLLSTDTCKSYWSRFSTHSMVCAAFRGVGFYHGDSGGSMVCPKNGHWTLVGILSYFRKNNPTRRPFVATRVPTFMPWIEEIVTHN